MTEDDIRRIIREELERSREPTTYLGIPLPANSPVVRGQNPTPNTCVYGGGWGS